jgi:hypothetical protein
MMSKTRAEEDNQAQDEQREREALRAAHRYLSGVYMNDDGLEVVHLKVALTMIKDRLARHQATAGEAYVLAAAVYAAFDAEYPIETLSPLSAGASWINAYGILAAQSEVRDTQSLINDLSEDSKHTYDLSAIPDIETSAAGDYQQHGLWFFNDDTTELTKSERGQRAAAKRKTVAR